MKKKHLIIVISFFIISIASIIVVVLNFSLIKEGFITQKIAKDDEKNVNHLMKYRALENMSDEELAELEIALADGQAIALLIRMNVYGLDINKYPSLHKLTPEKAEYLMAYLYGLAPENELIKDAISKQRQAVGNLNNDAKQIGTKELDSLIADLSPAIIEELQIAKTDKEALKIIIIDSGLGSLLRLSDDKYKNLRSASFTEVRKIGSYINKWLTQSGAMPDVISEVSQIVGDPNKWQLESQKARESAAQRMKQDFEVTLRYE